MTDETSLTAPTIWKQRFTEALTLLCGEAPPEVSVDAWVQKDDQGTLESWAAEKSKLAWAKGIVVIVASMMMADAAAEVDGHTHPDREPRSSDSEPGQHDRKAH